MNDYGLLPTDPIPPPVTVFFEPHIAQERGRGRVQLDKPYITRCQIDSKLGWCHWVHCPQNRDDEPNTSGRHCPLFCGLEVEE